MRFKIEQLKQTNVTTKYGPKVKYSFVSNGQSYDAWAKKGYTDNFRVGFEFEAEFTEKPNPKGGTYKNIQWPKQQGYSQRATEMYQALGATPQDHSIHAKLDEILRILKSPVIQVPKGASIFDSGTGKISILEEDIPYADSPPPSDDDKGPY